MNVIWGFTFIAAKVEVDAFPPLWFTGLRFLVIAHVPGPDPEGSGAAR